MEARYGRQTPTTSVILPYEKTFGNEAIELYNQSKRKAHEWQELLAYDIMAVNNDGLWIHQKFGFSVPRRNGKNEVDVIREVWGLIHGEKICHTAHRTTTSHQAWDRLCKVMTEIGYVELGRRKKDEEIPEKSYKVIRQYGLEQIAVTNGGTAVFRTRTANGGLGEGFDLLVIDEAQEYTEAQDTALKYTVSDSKNPQTIFCGTPPTLVSVGTVFPKMREKVLQGNSYDTGWAEWSVDNKPRKLDDVDVWYETNPSMGYHLDERKIRAELGDDELDFIIQRLGFWFQYNLKSEITEEEWVSLKCGSKPEFIGNLYIGIKYAKDGNNVAMSVAVKTTDDKVFVESIDCRPVKSGNAWIVSFLRKAQTKQIVVDGSGQQQILAEDMKDAGISKKPVLPTVAQVEVANAAFEKSLESRNICHMNQPSLTWVVSNCEKRAIGTRGGFGYKAIKEGPEIALMDSMILAYWACMSDKKPKVKQQIRY